jgi:hypothetical protein
MTEELPEYQKQNNLITEIQKESQKYASPSASDTLGDNRVQDFLNDAEIALGKDNFTLAKLHIDRHRDQQRGFTSEIYNVTVDGKKTTVYRTDQRINTDQPNAADTFENWAVMGLSYFQTAIAMVEIEEEIQKKKQSWNFSAALLWILGCKTPGTLVPTKDTNSTLQYLKTEIKNDSIKFLKNISRKKSSDDARNYMAAIVRDSLAPKLSEALKKPKKDIIKKLQKYKDFTNMDGESIAHETWTRHNPGSNSEATDLVVIDIPVTKLTDSQIGEFKAISGEGMGSTPPAWFTSQKLEDQAWIRRAAPKILQGNMIPTQMLQFIPSLRRMERTVGLSVSTDGENKTFSEFYQGYSAGNIGTVQK